MGTRNHILSYNISVMFFYGLSGGKSGTIHPSTIYINKNMNTLSISNI